MIRFAFERIPWLETSMRVGRPQPGEGETNGARVLVVGEGMDLQDIREIEPTEPGNGLALIGGHKSRSVGTVLVYAYWFNIILNGPSFSFPKWPCLDHKLCGYLTCEA